MPTGVMGVKRAPLRSLKLLKGAFVGCSSGDSCVAMAPGVVVEKHEESLSDSEAAHDGLRMYTFWQ